MRTQLFWDGNKRTAIVSTNTIMMLNGLGSEYQRTTIRKVESIVVRFL